jgi:uncharacterized protein YfbU (UPF0304 family)
MILTGLEKGISALDKISPRLATEKQSEHATFRQRKKTACLTVGDMTVAEQIRSVGVLDLSSSERRILINQMKILASLYPLEAKSYEREITMLSIGSPEVYWQTTLREFNKSRLNEEMNFVYQVLQFYETLQNSYYALDLREKIQLDNSALVFPGFHSTQEAILKDYMNFLLDNLGRFSFLETRKPPHSIRPMREFYQELLKQYSSHDDNALFNFAQITSIIAQISKLLMSLEDAVNPERNATAA